METLGNLAFGLGVALSWQNIVYCFIGCFLGTLVGVLPGIGPVATVAIGKPGATNAGILAAQMIGLSDTAVGKKLDAHKEKLARGVEEKSKKLKSLQST